MQGGERTATRLLSAILMSSFALGSLAAPPPGECPQPRFTGTAPTEYISRKSAIAGNADDIRQGESLFLGEATSVNCAICHGKKGDGKGPLAKQYDPPPRNFACAKVVVGIPDGQLFWIIRFGSPGTAMPDHPSLKDEQIWQIIAHLRQIAR